MFTAIQAQAQIGNIQSLIVASGSLIDTLVVAAFALSLLLFLWGLAVFILNAGDEKKIADGRRLMVWGIIALFVVTSIWGIVSFLQGTFGVGGDGPIQSGVDDVFPNPDTV